MNTPSCQACGAALDPAQGRCPACGAVPAGTTVPMFVSHDRSEFDDLKGVRRELEEALAPGIEIVRPLGRGGMGAVFLARDLVLKRQVVVKVLAPDRVHDPTAAQRFAREAESAAAVSHPNVVGVFQVGQLPRSGTSYFVMQYVEGPTLDQACPLGTKVLQARCRRIVGEIASALAAAHARGLVHRDIKPSNVILHGPAERAIVLDFGISAAALPDGARAGERLTATGASIGTPEYMSPEQAAGQDVTDKSDIYSLGVVAFELLAGRAPFEAPTALGLLAAHMKDPAPKIASMRPDLDADVADLVDRMLAKAPRDRPAAAEVARALLPVAHVVEWPPPGLERLRGRAAFGLRALLVATAMLAVYFAALALRSRDDLWWVLINTALALVVAVAVATAGLALGMASRLVGWTRRSGYPFRVAIDVALDRYDDTTALLNGTGRFASLPEGTGWRWLARRRWAAGLVLAGTAATAGLVTLWAAGALRLAPAGATSLVSLADSAAIFSPTLAAMALAAFFRWPETRMRGRLRPFGEVPVREPRLVPRDLVAGWLASAGLPSPEAVGMGRRRAVWLVDLPLAMILLLAMFGLAGSHMSAVFLPARLDRRGALERDRWEQTVREGRARAGDWRAVDGLAVRTARMAGRRRDVGAARALAATQDSVPLDPGLLWSAFRSLPGPLPDSLRVTLAGAMGPQTLALWRRLAASARLPALWYAPAGALASDSLDRLARPLATVQRLAIRHGGVAALALERGDRAGAVARAREIIATGRLLWNDPLPAAYLHGAGVLEVGTRILAAVATVTGDRGLARESDTLRATLDARRAAAAQFNRGPLGRYAASPLDTLLVAMAGDRGLAPVDRWAAIAGLAQGACWNPAEIRSGVSPLRFAALALAGERAADIAHSAEWAAEQRGSLDQLHAASALRLEGSPWPFRWLKPVRRALWCSGVRAG